MYKNSTDRQPNTRMGRLNRAVRVFSGPDSIYIQSKIRDVLEVLYPEHRTSIQTIQSLEGNLFFIRIPREIPDLDYENL